MALGNHGASTLSLVWLWSGLLAGLPKEQVSTKKLHLLNQWYLPKRPRTLTQPPCLPLTQPPCLALTLPLDTRPHKRAKDVLLLPTRGIDHQESAERTSVHEKYCSDRCLATQDPRLSPNTQTPKRQMSPSHASKDCHPARWVGPGVVLTN